jgi:hypothetical protein
MTFFSRDGVGRVIGKSYVAPEGRPEIQDVPDVSYSFDANGNLTGNADGSAGWGYDNLDRLTAESRGGTDAGRRLCAKGARGCDPVRLLAALMNDGNKAPAAVFFSKDVRRRDEQKKPSFFL